MDISKTDPKKNDSKSEIKIPPTPKTLSRISGNKVESAHSKIPKKNICSARESIISNIGSKTKKLSMMKLNLPKTTSLASTRSCLNSHRSVKSKVQTPRLENTDKISDIKKRCERAEYNRNLQAFEAAKTKLQNCHTRFMSKYDLVKDELPKEQRNLNLEWLLNSNEGQLLTKSQPTKTVAMCDKKTLEELKTSWKNFGQEKLEAIDTLDKLAKSSREIGDTYSKDHEHFKIIEEARQNLQIAKQTFLEDFLNQIESLQANDELKESTPNKEFEIKVKSLIDEVNALRKNLEEAQADLNRIKKSCDQKCCTFKKELEEKNKSQIKKQMEFDELKKKCDCLEKESFKAKSISKDVGEKLNKQKNELGELNQKLKTCAFNNVNLEVKNKNLELTIDKLKMELNAAVSCEKDIMRDLTSKHTDEMNILTNELKKAQVEKENFEKEVQSLRNESIKLQNIQSQFSQLLDEVNQANKEKQNLSQNITDLKGKLETCQNHASVSRDVQEELTRLKLADNSSNEKIKNLETELTKAQFQVKKLEEKITMDGKLLKVRTDLIDSLQKKEQTQKVRLTDLFTQVGEKSNDLHMIKTEMLTKTEEFQKLFSTLSTKQMELTRQEHMIKLLQENNERAQNLRVRQEAKIARLEEELIELKQRISIYQDVILPNNTLRRNLAFAEACRVDCSDSLGFYVEERRKKRQIDINVKKYEK